MPEIQKARVSVIGAGAIGRSLIMQLAGIGTPTIEVIDFDTVEEINIAVQGYREVDLGKPKVEAIQNAVREFTSTTKILPVNAAFWRGNHPAIPENVGRVDLVSGNVLFLAADNIETRKLAWELFKDLGDLLIDGRMVAETMHVFTAITQDEESVSKYEKSLFGAGEAEQASCTARSTLYSSNIIAGLMVHQFVRWLRGQMLDPSLLMVLPASTLVVDFQEAQRKEEVKNAV